MNTCTVVENGERCAQAFLARGMCGKHYARWQHHGDPFKQDRVVPLAERFWAKVDKDGPIPDHAPQLGQCWLWTASVDTKGYGQIQRGERGGGNLRAHRVAHELLRGSLDPELVIDHLCRNTRCVNPDHLEQVTQAENMARSEIREGLRKWKAAITHCPRGHAYDEANTYVKKGCRQCRACHRERMRGRSTFA